MLFASMADRWTGSCVIPPPALRGALQPDAPVSVLRLSQIESRLFHQYVHGGLQQQDRECSVFSRVSMLPALDTPLVKLCDSWLGDLASREPGSADLSRARCHAAIRARQYIDAHLEQPLTLASVCHASFSSPRALEYGFREIFSVSPITYIRCARLSRVRRELRLSTQIHGRVTQLAMKWGFWHLSQFSSDYYELFGELPSTTLARAAARLDHPEDAREIAQVQSALQCTFDGSDDLVRRAGFHQHDVEEL
jgi:AraC-like DNA-binding protein